MPLKETSEVICPYCRKPIEAPFGRGVPCPECGGKLDIFDDKHPLKPRGLLAVEKHFQIRLLNPSGSADDFVDGFILKQVANFLSRQS